MHVSNFNFHTVYFFFFLLIRFLHFNAERKCALFHRFSFPIFHFPFVFARRRAPKWFTALDSAIVGGWWKNGAWLHLAADLVCQRFYLMPKAKQYAQRQRGRFWQRAQL